MKLTVNPELLDETAPDGSPALPAGVFAVEDWDPKEHPNRAELFRANDRVYTLPRYVDPRLAFRFMRSLRKGVDSEVAMANLLGDALGDAIMDVLAEEELEPAQFKAVMKAVTKHTMGAMQEALGG